MYKIHLACTDNGPPFVSKHTLSIIRQHYTARAHPAPSPWTHPAALHPERTLQHLPGRILQPPGPRGAPAFYAALPGCERSKRCPLPLFMLTPKNNPAQKAGSLKRINLVSLDLIKLVHIVQQLRELLAAKYRGCGSPPPYSQPPFPPALLHRYPQIERIRTA